MLSQVNDQGNISRSQTLTIYPYNAYSKTAQKEYEKRLDKYNVDRESWQENITNLALAMTGPGSEDQIVNYFTIDRFGLWNCAREISKEIMTDQISDFVATNDSFEPVRIYVFNDRHSVYMSKETDIYKDHYQIDDADTRILARDKDGNMFICHQKEAEIDGFKLYFEPVTGATREELDKIFDQVGYCVDCSS